ncbi:MAG: flagellar filament capping protein FliD [Proteobacteria bacterium]|nr:flagellar filament capping protein FliD [Pseudomonadota bacterium]
MATEISSNPNIITGLASGMDTKAIVEQMIAAERRKLDPIEGRKESKTLEVDAWRQTKIYLDAVKMTAESLSKKSLWEGKLVSSSNPDVVEAIATSGAKPGKHTLVVDKLALNHQIASQGFATKEEQVGRGEVLISIGEDQTEKLLIDETNDNLQGYVDAINAMDTDVTASIIKTGNKEKPFQLVLTSKKTGREGEIKVDSYLRGEGEAPTFDPYYLQPGKWTGIARKEEAPLKPTGTGASTAIPELIGTYTGEESLELTFTAVNTGIVGVSESLKMRWEDDKGNYGYLDLGSFNYTPGEPLEVTDGISLILSDGEIIVNDSFTAKAKPQESELYWWKDEEERTAAITQPSSWKRQSTEGGPIITGEYDSEDDDVFTLRVVGSGQIGQADDLKIEYESENGTKGTAFVGNGYEPGTKLSLGKGLELTLKPGLLNDGDYATFEYQAESTANYWWLEETERHEGGQVTDLTQWISPEVEDEEEEFKPPEEKPVGARVSNAEKRIVGNYTEFEPKTYTFTALGSGSVGVTKELDLRWEDDQGNSGIAKVGGDSYQIGAALEFDSGLSLVLGEGSIFETDTFSFRTFTPVIQPPQDAEIRLGATDLGGGLLITNSTNELEDVIDGVKLNLLATDEKPVTINIRGDTEKALAGIKEFVNAYNSMLLFFKEVTKYDEKTQEAAPLQGDRNLPKIQSESNRIFIDTVAGLQSQKNMLISIGLKLNRDGLIDVDEEKLTNSINDNLSEVADLFRSHGFTENSGIIYLSSSEKTKISGPDGFEIDIVTPATKGTYTTRTHLGPIQINDENNQLYVSVNGRESEIITLEKGLWKIEDIARDLQRKIINDKSMGRMKIAVTAETGKLTIRSNVTGSKSSVSLRIENTDNVLTHPLMNGTGTNGTNVVGMVNGVPMDGNGQILSGMEDSDYEGLKLYVTLTGNQLGEGSEANMIFTKGVGTKVMEYIDQLTEVEKGALDVYTKNAEEQLKNYNKELKILEERISAKRDKLTMKFAKMEAQLGQLKSEQKYMAGELAKLG